MKYVGLFTIILLVLALTLVIAGCGKRGTENAGNGTGSSGIGGSSESSGISESTGSSGGAGNAGNAGNNASSTPSNTPGSPAPAAETWTAPHSDNNPVVTIEMENGQTIQIELFPDIAPNTVRNFISLASQGFYDGLIFHRVIPGFMIQGGDPLGNGTGGPGYAIKGEFAANGFQNDLPHKRGVISMARTNHPDTAGSQFFIMVDDHPHLDGGYAAFGYVTQGMETVDEIVMQEIDPNDPSRSRPLNPMAIKKMTVDTKGTDYPEPEIIK